MNGMKIEFNGKCRILPGEKVDGFQALVQNALVCLATTVGTDKAFPEKGTKLVKQGLQGALVNLATANQASQFASIDVLYFINEHDDDPARSLSNIQLSPVLFNLGRLELNSVFTSSLGETLGTAALITP